jgi:hypothetical protein
MRTKIPIALSATALIVALFGSTPLGQAAEHGVRATLVATKVIRGPRGPRGLQGPQGPQGLQGTKGDTGAKGDQGPVGPRGDTGSQGVKGDPGSKGDAGSTGPAGPVGPAGPTGLNWRAAWSAITPYATKDAVSYLGSSYISKAASTGVAPDSANGSTYWDLLAVKGATGSTGAQGAPGPQGATGATGPAGPAGPQGIQGVQGPQGPAGTVDTSNFYTKTQSDGRFAPMLGSGAYEVMNTNGPLPVTSNSFTTRGGTLMIWISGSGSRSAAQGPGEMYTYVQLDGSYVYWVHPSGAFAQFLYLYANQTDTHMAFPTLMLVATNVPAGTHTITIPASSTMATDFYDRYQVNVLEIPATCASGSQCPAS